MLISFHILLAIISLAFIGYMSLHPVKKKLRITYMFIALTVFSGVMYIFDNPSALIQMIIPGIFYASIVMVCASIAHTKLSHRSSFRLRA